MDPPSDWLSIIHLLGAAQGVFLAALLLGSRRNATANRLLAVAMLGFSIDLVTAAYFNRGWHIAAPHFMGADFLLPFVYGPVILLYAKCVAGGSQSLSRRDALHFVPLVLFAILLVPFYLQSGAEKIAAHADPEGGEWTARLTIINHVKLLYGLAYLVATFSLLRRHVARVKSTFSSIEHINLRWLRNLLIGGLVAWGVAFGFHVVWIRAPFGTADPIEGYDDVVLLFVAVLVYAIGYLGLRQPEIFFPAGDALESGPSRKKSAEPAKGRYMKSGLTASEAEEYMGRLVRLMESEKPYMDPGLTLQKLAARLSLSPHNLSEVINVQAEKTFYDFVNAYRVREVAEQLSRPSNRNLTILSLGLDAGFNSKSSFNSVFKKHTGMTPSEYRERNAGDAE